MYSRRRVTMRGDVPIPHSEPSSWLGHWAGKVWKVGEPKHGALRNQADWSGFVHLDG